MDAVGVEQRLGGGIVALRLDALHLGEECPHAAPERLCVGHDVIRLPVASAHLDRLRVGHQPADDHLPVAHVVFFDLRALADAPQLHERVACVRLVLRPDDLVVVRGSQQAELDQLRIREEVEGHEIRARLFERRKLLLEHALRIALESLLHFSRRMPDHLVHVGRELAGEGAPFRRARDFLRRPGELGPERRQRRLVVGLVDVREGDGLAAVPLAHPLIVRQVDAHRCDRARIADLDDDVDRVGGDALDAGFPIGRVPRHAVLEPLRVLRQLLNFGGLLAVDVEDQALPGALHAAGVEVDLDEPVDGVHRGRLVLDPGDVVRDAVGGLAAPVERHQRPEGVGHGRRGEGDGRFEMRDDRGNLRAVASLLAVDLFDERAVVLLHQPGVQRIPLGEALHVLHGDAGVKVVRAGGKDVLAGRRCFGRDH